jgi:hypothetical protein
MVGIGHILAHHPFVDGDRPCERCRHAVDIDRRSTAGSRSAGRQSARSNNRAITTRQYARLVSQWMDDVPAVWRDRGGAATVAEKIDEEAPPPAPASKARSSHRRHRDQPDRRRGNPDSEPGVLAIDLPGGGDDRSPCASNECLKMSGLGLGCVKTPAPAARVEESRGIARRGSQILLRTHSSMPCGRIVFYTFCQWMSFHTA